MARPPAKELTERELELMHIFWRRGEATAAEIRDELAAEGTELAAATVTTLVKILADKGFLRAQNDVRPIRYAPARSFEDVSGQMLGHVIDRVFKGSRQRLLISLLGQKALSKREKQRIEAILRDEDQGDDQERSS